MIRRLFIIISIILDILAIAISSVLVYWLRFHSGLFPYRKEIPLSYYFLLIPIFIIINIVCIASFGLYKRNAGLEKIDEPHNLLKAVAISSLILISIIFLYKGFHYSRLIILMLAIFIFIFLNISHFILRKIESALFKEILPVLVIGAGTEGKNIVSRINRHPELKYKVIGFLDSHHKIEESIEGVKVLGGINDLGKVIEQKEIKEVIVALPRVSHEKILDIILYCQRRGIQARVLSDIFEILIDQVKVGEINGIPLFGLKEEVLTGTRLLIKRTIDIIIVFSCLVFFMPLFILIAILIKLDSSGPVFYTQTRVGLKGKTFKMYKFRSMIVNAHDMLPKLQELNEVKGFIFKIKKDPRITRFGKILRRFSLDELPQLINVFKGQMSIIGPRPPIPREVEKYSEWHKRRLDVLPGITGLWQVSGRNELSFDVMVKLDLYYIENWSLWLDMRILLKTVQAVLSTRGAY